MRNLLSSDPLAAETDTLQAGTELVDHAHLTTSQAILGTLSIMAGPAVCWSSPDGLSCRFRIMRGSERYPDGSRAEQLSTLYCRRLGFPVHQAAQVVSVS